MTPVPRNHGPPLTLVAKPGRAPEAAIRGRAAAGRPELAARELDWSILMARAQDGDGEAYRRLLEQIAPYLRALAARRHRDPRDVEDAIQDVLLTLHAIRQTYDPTRPFGPWLLAIAQRRLIDRLRRQGRLRARETALAAAHETFPDPKANVEKEVSDRHDLERALASLPPRQSQAVRLLKLEALSLKEAAAATGMSVAALKVATHRALKSLRKILSNRGDRT